jgi:hypothetical protein
MEGDHMRHHRTLSTALAILTTAAGASALAGSAQAAVIQNSWFSMIGDPAGEISLPGGNVAYDWSHGNTTAHVTGTVKVVKGDDASYRVRIDSLDENSDVLGTTYDTTKPKGHHYLDDAEHEFSVDMYGTSAPNVKSVKIALEKMSGDNWNEKDHVYWPVFTPAQDDVQILDAGVDVGGSGFDHATHQPTGPAKVSWQIDDTGALKATYEGSVHLESKFFGVKARVQLRALNNAGKVLATDNGDAHWQPTPAYQFDSDTLSVTTTEATRVKVKLQTSTDDDAQGNPIWQDVPGDEQIVSVTD